MLCMAGRGAHAGLSIVPGGAEHEAGAGLAPQAKRIVPPQHLRLWEVLHQIGCCSLQPALQALLGSPPFPDPDDSCQRPAQCAADQSLARGCFATTYIAGRLQCWEPACSHGAACEKS